MAALPVFEHEPIRRCSNGSGVGRQAATLSSLSAPPRATIYIVTDLKVTEQPIDTATAVGKCCSSRRVGPSAIARTLGIGRASVYRALGEQFRWSAIQISINVAMKATSQRLGTQTLAEGLAIENNGALIISPVTHRPSLQRMGIDTTKAVNVGLFTSGQKQFLDFHRNAVLLQSIRG
jgi:hypothetical protein